MATPMPFVRGPNSLDVLGVVAAGAVGGFLAVAGALTHPEVWRAFGLHHWFKYVILPLLLGGLAGGVAVFVLAHFDATNRIRMFFFAATCGLGFPNVLDSAKDLVGGRQAQEAYNQAAVDEAANLTALLDRDSSDAAGIAQKVNEVLAFAPNITSLQSKEAIWNSLGSAIDAIPDLDDGATAARSLGDVATGAASAGEFGVTARAVRTLDQVSRASSTPEVAGLVKAYRRAVRRQLPKDERDALLAVAMPAPAASALQNIGE